MDVPRELVTTVLKVVQATWPRVKTGATSSFEPTNPKDVLSQETVFLISNAVIKKKGNSNTKSLAYMSLVHPILEYGATCWDP